MPENPPNHLIGETSPYLLQHLFNPVDWHPWNDETLYRARAENKLMVISIGYSACHWCHVMEKESFEDREVASLMNRHYVSIKVDREERPDVDQVYMTAAYIVSGRGGWPLNVIALPDGRPVFAGTYFNRDQWIYLLDFLAKNFQSDPDELVRQADAIHLKMTFPENLRPSGSLTPGNAQLPDNLFLEWQKILDDQDGGTIGAPKFPMPVNFEYLLRYGVISGNRKAIDAVNLTLRKMACGGIYDHIGGGFSRYSVDDRWHIPHFEKMLYDNAQLVNLYAQGFQHSREPLYREVVEDTLRFIERELTSPEGLFYASLDADSAEGEGAYYAWTADELQDMLKEDAQLFMDYFGISENGNWENGKNILFVNRSPDELPVKYSMEKEHIDQKIRKCKEKALEVRGKRAKPGLDNKVITAWNALMISGLVSAYKACDEEMYLRKAEKAARIYAGILEDHQRLFRLFPASGIQSPPAFLDDYAFMIKAFLDLYQATFAPEWLDKAEMMIGHTITHFFDDHTGLFYYTSDTSPALIDRKKEIPDNVTPSSNSQMALNLLVFGHISGKEKWNNLAVAMLQKVYSGIQSEPSFYGNWAIGLLLAIYPPYEVAIVGANCKSILRQFNAGYLPQALFCGSEDGLYPDPVKGRFREGKTLIYVCRERTCSEPLNNAAETIQRILFRE